MKFNPGKLACVFSLTLPVLILLYQFWPRPSSSYSSNGWMILSNVAPPGLMTQVAADNLTPQVDTQLGSMNVLRPWQSGQAKALYLIDSRAASQSPEESPLCGALGCAFYGYVPDDRGGFQQVLNLYLDPHLPPEIPMIEASEQLHEDMPELIIHQLEDRQLLRMRLTFNNERYEVVETQYLALKDE